jgi:hypothetical protein
MPTKHSRIGVVEDPELHEAIEKVAPYFTGAARATIVHDLAVKGAELLLEQRARDANAIEALVKASTTRDGSIEWSVLDDIDRRAWGE